MDENAFRIFNLFLSKQAVAGISRSTVERFPNQFWRTDAKVTLLPNQWSPDCRHMYKLFGQLKINNIVTFSINAMPTKSPFVIILSHIFWISSLFKFHVFHNLLFFFHMWIHVVRYYYILPCYNIITRHQKTLTLSGSNVFA